jgi:hypothetical protein
MEKPLFRINLLRFLRTPEFTIGCVTAPGLQPLYTLEPPWKDNQRNISSVPHGTYAVDRYASEKFGKCLCLLDVPNRAGILFHPMNSVKETEGCIGLGYNFDRGVMGEPVFLQMSKNATESFTNFVYSKFTAKNLVVLDIWDLELTKNGKS